VTDLVAYADLEQDALVSAALAVEAGGREQPAAVAALERALFDADAAPPAAIGRAVVASRGPFARAARRGLADGDARVAFAARELDALGALAHGLADAAPELAAFTLPQLPAVFRDDLLPPPAAHLVGALATRPDWGALAGELADFHRREGCGDLAVHRVLRFAGGRLLGIARPDPISLDDLVGFEAERRPLLEDLSAFCEGEPANDALLYGLPGTGKSATVRACARVFAAHGLRLVQAGHDELEHLDAILGELAGEGPPALLFLDDLVFDDASRGDRALRAALEGGVEARPANVLIWATSNRLNLTRASHAERADAVDPGEDRGEKVALANRFGRRVRFEVRGEDAYVEIVRHLLEARLGQVPDDAEDLALRFARTGPGPTPRGAHQFAASYRRAS
jgi:hypothetical protein